MDEVAGVDDDSLKGLPGTSGGEGGGGEFEQEATTGVDRWTGEGGTMGLAGTSGGRFDGEAVAGVDATGIGIWGLWARSSTVIFSQSDCSSRVQSL